MTLSSEAEMLLPTIIELFRKGVLKIDVKTEYDKNDDNCVKYYPCIIFEYQREHKIISVSESPIRIIN